MPIVAEATGTATPITPPLVPAARLLAGAPKLEQPVLPKFAPSEADLLRCRIPSSIAEFLSIHRRLAELEER
jgi:hypothetical protein